MATHQGHYHTFCAQSIYTDKNSAQNFCTTLRKMAEYIDISELEEKKRQAEEAAGSNMTITHMGTGENQEFEKTVYTSDEELDVLLQEKLILHEKGKELKTLVSNMQVENLKRTEEVEDREEALKNKEKTEKHVADLIRNRLSEIHAHCKKFEDYFEKFLTNIRNKLQEIRKLSGKDEVAIEQKLAIAESLFTSFNEKISTIELLMKPDYDILCHEDGDCFNIVMKECNKVEDNLNKLMSILIKK